MKISKKLADELFEILYETEFEIWNNSCTGRLKLNHTSDATYIVSPPDEPSNGKEFKSLKGALNYLKRMDDKYNKR